MGLSHLAALRDALPKSSVAAVEGAEVARAACVTYEEWREKQRWAADAYSSAQKELRHASDAVSSATEAVAACESEQTASKQELDQVKAELDSFNSWNMECLRMLRDRLSKKAESQEKDTSAPVPAENLVATQVLEAGADRPPRILVDTASLVSLWDSRHHVINCVARQIVRTQCGLGPNSHLQSSEIATNAHVIGANSSFPVRLRRLINTEPECAKESIHVSNAW